MEFVNPLEILGIESADAAAIKKAKRRKLAEIELSDEGVLEHEGRNITKSDFLRVVNELDDPEKSSFYSLVHSHADLELFLTKGDPGFFDQDSNPPEFDAQGFKEFISPYFAARLDKSLLKAWRDKDIFKIRQLSQRKALVSLVQEGDAYTGVYQLIKGMHKELEVIWDEVGDENGVWNKQNAAEVQVKVSAMVDVIALNALPKYFQPVRNEIGSMLRNISVAHYNRFDLADTSVILTQLAKDLRTSGLTTNKIEEDHGQISEIHEDRKAVEESKDELGKYIALSKVIDEAYELADDAKPEEEMLEGIVAEMDVSELNAGEGRAYKAKREELALSLRGLAVRLWNNHNDMKFASSFIKMAASLDVNPETKSTVNEDLETIERLEEEHGIYLRCWFCEENNPEDSTAYKTTIYKEAYRSYNKVTYNQAEVTLPRCSGCKSVHNNADLYFWLIIVFSVFIGYLIGTAVDLWAGGLAVGLGGGIIAAYIVSNSMYTKNNIRSTGNGTLKEFPIIKERLRDGWQMHQPSA